MTFLYGSPLVPGKGNIHGIRVLFFTFSKCNSHIVFCSFSSSSLLSTPGLPIVSTLLLVRNSKRGGDRVKIKLFGTAASLPVRKDGGGRAEQAMGSEGGVNRSIHHDCRLTQQKMECWERPLGCEGPGNSNNIFWRLSGCPIREADI